MENIEYSENYFCKLVEKVGFYKYIAVERYSTIKIHGSPDIFLIYNQNFSERLGGFSYEILRFIQEKRSFFEILSFFKTIKAEDEQQLVESIFLHLAFLRKKNLVTIIE